MKFLDALELNEVKETFAKQTSFSLGQDYIRSSTIRSEYLWIERELQRVEEAYKLVVKKSAPGLSGASDTSEIIIACQKQITARPFDLYSIIKTERAVREVVSYFKDEEAELLLALIDSFTLHEELIRRIESCIGINYEVLDQASPALKEIRSKMKSLQSQVSKETSGLISKYSSYLMEQILVMRNERACLLVKQADKNKVKGFIHGESASGQAVYIEPESLLRLNNELQIYASKEEEEIVRILMSLTYDVAEVGDELLANLDSLGMVDGIFAKAKWMKNYDACVATIKKDGRSLLLKDARHPLIDQKKVVANTYQLKESQRMLLITGSNTGGKTVSLKTIGLFVAMSLSGFPIAATKAEIPLYDGIYSDIGDSQSIQESLSTFSAHISTLAYILDHATSKSLVLLDELGSGTDPREGESLAIAILDNLRRRDVTVISTTHFSELKKYGTKHDDVLLASVAFNEESMMPTYKFVEGISGQSNAFSIARRYHLSEEVLQEAQELREAMKSEEDLLMERLEKEYYEQQRVQKELEQQRIDLEQQIVEAKKSFANQEKELLNAYNKKEELLIQEVEVIKEEARLVLESLKEKTELKQHEIIEANYSIDQLEVDEVEEEDNREFKVGDYVCLDAYQYYGEIVEMKRKEATVFTNGMRMKVKTNELSHAKRPKEKRTESYSVKTNSKSVPMELNLIGLTREEALRELRTYIDRAAVAKKSMVRVVHGVGTLVLRKAVHEELSKNKLVKNFETAAQSQGGLGATVVELGKRDK